MFLIARADGVSFCVQAHEDDWQLFNSKNIINDISRDTKIVFITVTAGNIGQKGDENQEIYYIYREKASVFSAAHHDMNLFIFMSITMVFLFLSRQRRLPRLPPLDSVGTKADTGF